MHGGILGKDRSCLLKSVGYSAASVCQQLLGGVVVARALVIALLRIAAEHPVSSGLGDGQL